MQQPNQRRSKQNTYSADAVEFSLYKVATSSKLQTVSGKGGYYDADTGYNYVDVVLNITNNGTEDFSADSITASFEADNGTRYEDTLIAVEDSDDYLNIWGAIKPLASNKVHIGYKLPKEVAAGRAYFSLDDNAFVVEYDAAADISSKVPVSFNQEVAVDGTASFQLLQTNFTADVLPSNTSGWYSHYPVDDPSNDTYFVVYCSLTNHSSSAIGADDMISMKAIFDGQYEYTANMAVEKKDGAGFDYANITGIDPLETRKGVFMFEVPQKVQGMKCELSIYFYGTEYSAQV